MRAFRLILLLVWGYMSWDVLWLCKGPFGKSPGPEKHQTQTSKTAIIFAPYPLLQQRHPKTCQNWRMTIYLWPKNNSLPIWICVEIRGFPFPSRYILTAQNSCEVGYTSCNLWPSTSTDRSRNGSVGSATSFHNQEMEGFFWCPSAALKRRWTYPDLRSDEEKYSKYHHDMTIWTHFRTNS